MMTPTEAALMRIIAALCIELEIAPEALAITYAGLGKCKDFWRKVGIAGAALEERPDNDEGSFQCPSPPQSGTA